MAPDGSTCRAPAPSISATTCPLARKEIQVSSPHFDPDRVAVRQAHYIGGRYIDVGPGAPCIDVRRPSDAWVYAGVPVADEPIVDAAVESAWTAQRRSDWARCAPRERARILRRWAELIEADVQTLAPLESIGSTRPLRDAAAWDVPFTAEGLRFFAEYADKLGGDVAATRADHLGMTISEPYGVVAAIAPWNLPLVMASWKIGPALAAGNAVVLKPSELTPFSALRLAELATRAGVPDGIFTVVHARARRERACPMASSTSCRAMGARPAMRWCAIRASPRSASPARPPPARPSWRPARKAASSR